MNLAKVSIPTTLNTLKPPAKFVEKFKHLANPEAVALDSMTSIPKSSGKWITYGALGSMLASIGAFTGIAYHEGIEHLLEFSFPKAISLIASVATAFLGLPTALIGKSIQQAHQAGKTAVKLV